MTSDARTPTDRGRRRSLLIGVGNHDRGDDAVGPVVADVVHGLTDEVVTIVREGDLAVLPLLWDEHDDVTIVDAYRSDDPVGTVHRLDPAELETSFGLSTHGINVAEALALAHRLGRSPHRLRVLGVVGRRFGHEPMSPAMRASLPAVVSRVLAELGVDPPS